MFVHIHIFGGEPLVKINDSRIEVLKSKCRWDFCWICQSSYVWKLSFTFPSSVCESAYFPIALPTDIIVKFWVFAKLMWEKWYLSLILGCIYLILSDIEYLFMCLVAMFASHFLNGVLIYFVHSNIKFSILLASCLKSSL